MINTFHLLRLKNKKREINSYLFLINYFKYQQIYYQIYSTKRNLFDKLNHGNLFHFAIHYDSKLYTNSFIVQITWIEGATRVS